DDSIHAFEHELARCVVENLAGDGVELEPGLESADHADIDREQIQEQRAVSLRLQTDHLAAALRRCLGVDVMKVGGLPAKAGTVVNDLRGHLHGGVIKEDHRLLPKRRGFDGSTRYSALARISPARSL